MAQQATRLRSNLLILFLLALLVFACFGSTLEGYFNCDDYLHLPYLARLFNGEPELFLANFTGPWVGERTLYLFFRPLTEVSLMIDYFFNQTNPFGYHLSNLLWHTANTFLLFLFTKALLKKQAIGSSQDQLTMALTCSALFAVFPTHSEAVAWILARADLVSTFFFILSLYFFVTNCKNKALSLLAFFACLLSKETAISLPLVIFALSLYLSKASSKKDKLIEASKDFAPYLVTLIVYLIWRFLAIGKLVGGYVGSIGQRLYENYFERWITSGSLWQLLHPFKKAIFAENHVLRLVLRALYAIAGLLLVISIFIDEKVATRQRLAYFALAFFAATMLPNFQVWGLSSSMSGGRIAYLPCAALALLIVASIYILAIRSNFAKWSKALKAFSASMLIALVLTCTCITRGNNSAWLSAGAMVKQLKNQVASELKVLPPEKKLVLINLPSRVDGAYTFTMRSMLAGLFSKQDGERIIALDYHPNWSIFVNRNDFEVVQKQPQKYKLEAFDGSLGKLVEPDFSQPTATPLLSTAVANGPKSSSYYLKPEGETKFINPLNVEFLELDVKATKKANQLIEPKDKATLFAIWNNRPADQEDQSEPHWMAVKADGREHKVWFELGAQRRWLLSKNVDLIRLDVATDEYDWQISNAKLIDCEQAKTIMPILTVNNNDNFALAPLSADLKNKNLIGERERETAKAFTFNFDASKIKTDKIKACKVLVEVSKAYASFEHYNNVMRELSPSKYALLNSTLGSTSGSFALDTAATSTEKAAVYQVHIAALDDNGQVVGTFSDSITFKSGLPVAVTGLPKAIK
ncbi:hypothetical protein BH11CYA1_BH11CYA1_32460 [soil metagenome]